MEPARTCQGCVNSWYSPYKCLSCRNLREGSSLGGTTLQWDIVRIGGCLSNLIWSESWVWRHFLSLWMCSVFWPLGRGDFECVEWCCTSLSYGAGVDLGMNLLVWCFRARRGSVWLYVEPVERSRTSYEVLVRSVSNDNAVEEIYVSGVLSSKQKYKSKSVVGRRCCWFNP